MELTRARPVEDEVQVALPDGVSLAGVPMDKAIEG
jgi:hypothetical protein